VTFEPTPLQTPPLEAVEELTLQDMQKARAAIEYYYAKGWTDGLPVVPPVEEFVAELLAQTDRSPDEVLLVQKHLNRTCNIRQAAINAVMAGCKPEYFPVLLASLDAFRTMDSGGGLLQSTTGQATMLIVNGPARDKLGVNYLENIFGPGDRANATLGRALRLIIMNVLGVKPHEFDQSTQGTPAKFAFCIGENEEDSPWEPLHVERGFAPEASTATMMMVRSDLHVEHRSTQVPEEILMTIADSMSYAGGIYEAPPYNLNCVCAVVMGPEHANIIASKGWSKQDVKQFLWEHWGRTKQQLAVFGKTIGLEKEADDAFIHAAKGPDSILLVVSGAPNAGVSTVCPNFAPGDTRTPRNATAEIKLV
jgi:hypothetical protein